MYHGPGKFGRNREQASGNLADLVQWKTRGKATYADGNRNSEARYKDRHAAAFLLILPIVYRVASRADLRELGQQRRRIGDRTFGLGGHSR